MYTPTLPLVQELLLSLHFSPFLLSQKLQLPNYKEGACQQMRKTQQVPYRLGEWPSRHANWAWEEETSKKEVSFPQQP